MRKFRYKQIADIAFAVSQTSKPRPSVIAGRNVVINNVPFYLTLYMDGPEDPFIELLEEGEEELSTGYLHNFSEPELVDILRDILEDGSKEWTITNYEQVCNHLEDAASAGEFARKAFELVHEELTPDTVLSDFLSKLMGQYFIPMPEFHEQEEEKDAVRILNAYGGGIGDLDENEIEDFMDMLHG